MNLFPTQNITFLAVAVKHELFFKTLPFLMFLIHRDKTEEKLLLGVDSALHISSMSLYALITGSSHDRIYFFLFSCRSSKLNQIPILHSTIFRLELFPQNYVQFLEQHQRLGIMPLI
jgi:hypothetical protein